MKKVKVRLAIGFGLILGVLFLIMGLRDFRNSRRLIDHGIVTTGKVLDLEERRSRKGRRSYYLEVEYQTTARFSLTRRVRVDSGLFESVQAGSPIKVHYLPEEPAICALGETVPLQYSNILFGIVFLVGAGFLFVFIKKPADQAELTESVQEHVQGLQATEEQWGPADGRRFTHLDLKFYDSTQRNLESLGYRFISDIENIALRKRSGSQVFVRQLVSRDDSTVAGIYHHKSHWQYRVIGAKDAKVIDLESCLSDGTFLITTNAEMAGHLDSPPQLDTKTFPANTPWHLLAEAHKDRLGQHLTAHSGVSVVPLKTERNIACMQAEQRRIKGEYRKRVGISKQELEKIAGGKGKPIDDLHASLTSK